MDVLQLLKAEFRDRAADMSYLLSEDKKRDAQAMFQKLCVHIAWESQFLFPELAAISAAGDSVLNRYMQSLQALRKQTQVCLDGDSMPSTGRELAELFLKHSLWVEEKVFPLMRQKIPTGDREDLYHVFVDAKQDIYASLIPSMVV